MSMEVVTGLRNMGFDPLLLETLHDLLDFSDEQNQSSHQTPSRRYVREAKAQAATPADVKETPNAFVFVVDVPGLRSDMINVQVEEDNVLVVSGERRREKEKEQGIKYLRMERRLGKYLKKFVLPENADTGKISAECQDGVLTVTVEKKPPPEPKKPKTIQVQISSGGQGKQIVGQQGGQGGETGQRGGEGGGQQGGQGAHGEQQQGGGGQAGQQGGYGGQEEEEGGQGGEQRGSRGSEGSP